MKRTLLLSVALLLVQLLALAGPRSYQQAQKIAEQQAAKLGIVMNNPLMTPVRNAQRAGTTTADDAYYVFDNGHDRGFTIVSADDRLPDIVGYADQGNYDEATLPEGLVYFLKAYQELTDRVKKGDQRALRLAAEARALKASDYQQPTVQPLLGDIKWNQGNPYNLLCPEYETGRKAATGCVATAMAQVMGYWKYPQQLQADIPGYTTSSYNIFVSEIKKADGVYDWDNILPTYNNYNDTQANAVAKLMYHCGAAVKMNYGPESGANVYPQELATYFGYDSDLMAHVYRNNYPMAEWNEMIDRELTAKRPVLYGGFSTEGGHQFVCDGSDGNGLYHINWGWGGYQDGYFDITILNPGKGGIGSGSAPDGYNRGSSMIIGMMPDNGKIDEPLVEPRPIIFSYDSWNHRYNIKVGERTNASETFTVEICDDVQNWGTESITCKFAIGIKNADGKFTPISNIASINRLDPGYYTCPSFTCNYAFPIGITTLHAIYTQDNGTTWQEASYNNLTPYTLEATETQLKKATLLTASINPKENTVFKGCDNSFSIEVSNLVDFDFIGSVNIYVSSNNEKPQDATQDIYVSIPAKGKTSREIDVPIPNSDEVYLWITDTNTGFDLLPAPLKITTTENGTPNLTLVSTESNITPDEYETEKAFINGYKVKAPVVKGEKLTTTFNVRNDGATAKLACLIYGANCETFYYTGSRSSQIVLPGEGAITPITVSFTPDEIGSHTIFAELYNFHDSNNNEINLNIEPAEYFVYLADNPDRGFRFSAKRVIAYVTGETTAIDDISTEATSYVRGGTGEITICSDKAQSINVCKVNGHVVAHAKLAAGKPTTITVPAGIYVVNGKKVIVK